MSDITNDKKSEIVNPSMYIEALKSSGYKSTYNAIAEIIDNSVDAKAEDIFIIGEQKTSENGDRRIISFAFLDNGTGMAEDTLSKCLTIGFTTNQARKGMGRFGVGLPQASIFVCNRVEVYSWQNGIENTKKVYLDVEEVRSKNLNVIDEPEVVDIPEKYKQFILWKSRDKSYNFSEHGTLVVWTKCTSVDHKKWQTCMRYMSEDLGRKYRYFLASEKTRIKMIELISKQEEDILPNDPLYLMSPSQECVPNDVEQFIKDDYKSKNYNIVENYTDSLFEVYKPDETASDYVPVKITFEENEMKKTGIVNVKYSVVKRKYYSKAILKTEKKPGSLPFGKSNILQRNTGISIIRNGREIDFGSFGFFNYYNVPEYRWWGIEISFGTELDSAFGISNNKQYVNLKALSKEEMKNAEDDERTVWHQLAEEIMPTIDAMAKRNSEIRGEELIDTPIPPESSEIVNTVDGDIDGDLPTYVPSSEEKQIQEAEEELINEGNKNPTDNQIQKLIDSGVRVVSVYNKSKMDSFVDYSFAAGTLSIILNAQHSFYNNLVKHILDDDEKRIPFELFLIAVMKSIKKQNLENPDAMSKLLYAINCRITEYMNEFESRNSNE